MEIRHLDKHFILSSVLLTLTLLAIIFPLPTLAITYTPLVEGMPTVESSDISGYINALYTLAISLAALLAVVKIILAGMKYILSDVVPSKSDAKKDIWGAVIGLLIVLSAVLILNTINPNLTDFNIFKEAIYTEREYSGDLGEYCDTYSRSKECQEKDYYGAAGIRGNDSLGNPVLYDYQSLSATRVHQFIESCGSGKIVTSVDGSMTCRGGDQATLGSVVNTEEALELIPPSLADNEKQILTEQFREYVAPYEPKDVDINLIKEQTGANNVLFVVQQDLLQTRSNAGAESQQEAYCSAIGGEIVQGGSYYRACVN